MLGGMNDPRGQFDFDVVIIGAGSGGYAAARTAAGGHAAMRPARRATNGRSSAAGSTRFT